MSSLKKFLQIIKIIIKNPGVLVYVYEQDNPNKNEKTNNVMITARADEFPWIIINTIRINGIGGIGKNKL